MLFKFCIKCKSELDASSFHKDKRNSDGSCTYCKSCVLLMKQNAPAKVKHRRKQYNAAYYKKHVSQRGKPGSTRYEAKLAGFRSGFERTINANLISRGVKFTYETMQIPYTLDGTYNPDFLLENGIIIEVKGLLDRESKRKMAAVKKQHPTLDIRFVFGDASKKIPGTKQSHAQWADRNGFPWCEGTVPQEWLDE